MTEELEHPAVLAVVVATDGEPTLARTLDALAAQTYQRLTCVAVDNASRDGSRELLRAHLGSDAILVADRDLGFGGAVDMALDAQVARGHDLVLLVHDDLELRPDAVARLVDAFVRDPQLAIAGCKLVEWDDARQLQAVGMSVDLTGRADSGVEDDEIDQGQHDEVDDVLYVSTAGMMVRRSVFDALGRFDVRYHLFRDDLDLCWRAHLAGHRVEVVTAAVAAHDASASNYRRLGQTAILGPRYFAERNTLASLLKNYGPARLLVVVPLFLLVGLAKLVGFVATRRVGDAAQTVRAWAWNLLHLRETRRLRGLVQQQRVRADGELAPLFGRISTRLRAYLEAVVDVASGGSDSIEPSMPDPTQAEVPTLRQRAMTMLRTSPVGVAAVLLGLLGLYVAVPLLRGGPLRGGELAPWPEGVGTLLTTYLRPWELGDVPGVTSPSPALAGLGLVSVLATGSAWLAPRLLLLAIVPMAWAATLRAGRLVTNRRLPRVAGATLYALSPPVVAALRTGRVGAAVAAVLLPLLLIAGARAFGPATPRDRAWRATAALALLIALLVSVLPSSLVVVLAVAVATALAVPLLAHLPRRSTLRRLAAALLGATVLLLPSPPSFDPTPLVVEAAGSTSLWRVLVLSPDLAGFVTMVAGVGLFTAALLGLALVDEPRRGIVGAMWAALLAGVGAAWVLVRAGVDAPAWPGSPLLLAALSAAMLLCVAFSAAPRLLTEFDFGWRQLAAAGTTAVVVVGVVASALAVADGTWDAYATDDQGLPAFLATEPTAVGPFRVLVLADDGERIRWELTDADGPSVATVAAPLPEAGAELLGELVAAVLADADPDAAGELGLLNVRYVVVPEQGRSPRLEEVLTRQLDLTGQPVADGVVHRVDTWLPRWSVVSVEEAAVLAAEGRLPADTAPMWFDGELPPAGGVLLHADVVRDDHEVLVDGDVVAATPTGPTSGYVTPAGSDVEVRPVGWWTRSARVGVQAVLVLLALSLTLRAPRFARRTGAAS